MNIEQLLYIVEVAKTGSLTRAAQQLHLTMSALSQSLAHLEAELGVTLFIRSRLGAVPTAEGKVIIAKAAEVLLKLDELREEAQGMSNAIKGELRLATIPGPMSLLVNTVATFKKDYPNISIQIAELGTQEILQAIRENKLDIGLIILYEDLLQKETGVVFERLIEGRMVAGVSKQSPLAVKGALTPEELLKQTFVLYNDEYVKWFMDEFARVHGAIDMLFTTNNTDAIRKAVSEQLAVTVGLDYSFVSVPYIAWGDIVTVDLALPQNKPVWFGWVRSDQRVFSRVLQTFVNRLKHELQ